MKRHNYLTLPNSIFRRIIIKLVDLSRFVFPLVVGRQLKEFITQPLFMPHQKIESVEYNILILLIKIARVSNCSILLLHVLHSL